MTLKPPFPWFGGKSRVAPQVWERFGNVPNFVEPFFGSGAVLFGRPHKEFGIETVNDKDGFVSNFWRALQHDPEQVAAYADWPVNENDLHARHLWLVQQKETFLPRIEGDPDCYDAKIAGWWVWGICCWIGAEFCSGKGPWSQDENGQLVKSEGISGQGVHRQLVHLGNAGMGIKRRLVHLGSAGQGIHRQIVHLGNAEQGIHRKQSDLYAYFEALADRLRNVRVCCGDWLRVLGPSPTIKQGLTGVFLDPPYSAEAGRNNTVYRSEDLTVAHAVREWAITNGENPLLRIALCGYEGEHAMPDSWECVIWKARGGYGNEGNGSGKENARRERMYFSPHCLKLNKPHQYTLWAI